MIPSHIRITHRRREMSVERDLLTDDEELRDDTKTTLAKRKRKRSVVPQVIAVSAAFALCFLIALNGSQINTSMRMTAVLRLSRAAYVEPTLLSRDEEVQVTADVHGNLGPATVLNQKIPGSDWLKDRWQAASDMHGTAIHGAHWVQLAFPQIIMPQRLILDWETAVSTDYAIEGMLPANNEAEEWVPLFDSKRDSFSTIKFGQSPGVKKKLPLHILHNVTLAKVSQIDVQSIRIWIRSSDHGWGVSLWQADVYGWRR